ncbi:MAG: glucosyltransferase domain-containing protein [Firmicutes bacterium]|nr:glucosyltransferase domain-containing protein [Bacillota bacterium]
MTKLKTNKTKEIKQKIKNFADNFEENNYLINWYNNQPSSAKLGFWAAAVIAFATHYIIYANLLLEIHLPAFARSPTVAGRWMHPRITNLYFHFPNWMAGVLQMLFLAAMTFVVIKAFEVHNKIYALLIAGLLVSFPNITETNLYFHDAAPYFFGAFIATLGFYLTKIYKFGFILGSLCLMLSLAVYQSKVSVALIMIVIHLILYVLQNNPPFIAAFKYACRYIFLAVGGFSAYYISLIIFEVNAARVTSDVPLMEILQNLPSELLRVYREVFYYFFSSMPNVDFRSFIIYSRYLIAAYAFIFFVLAVTLLLIVISKIKAKQISVINIIIAVLLVALLPFAGHLSGLLRPPSEIQFITMTTYALVFLLFFPLILWENFKINIYGAKKLATFACVFIIGFYMAFANFVYTSMQARHMQIMNLANRLTLHIEPLLHYSDRNTIFIFGNNFRGNPLYPAINNFTEYTARTIQDSRVFGNDNITGWGAGFLVGVIRNRIGLEVRSPSNNERTALLQSAITQGMPVYPTEGSVAIIDNVVVVMNNFFGRVDIEQIEEIDQTTFSLTYNHTGKSTDLPFEYEWRFYRLENGNPQEITDLRTHENTGQVYFNPAEPGEYQVRVWLRFAEGFRGNSNSQNIINNWSAVWEVE